MVLEIQSKEVIDKISDELKVQPALEIPRQLAPNIQLTYGVNPLRIVNIVKSLAAAGTMYTTPLDRDFYLTFASASATISSATSVTPGITIVLAGQALIKILGVNMAAPAGVTGMCQAVSADFSTPILLEKGSTIVVTTLGAADSGFFSIAGYTTDPQ